MKVLYITNGDSYSGSSIALLNLIEYLKEKVEIEVVFPRKKGKISKVLNNNGIKNYHFRYTMSTYSNNKSFINRSIHNIYNIIIKYYGCLRLLNILYKSKPDIIHSNNGPTEIGYICSKITKIPHVWHLREYIDKDFDMHPIPSFSSYIKKYSDNNNFCITITDGVKQHFKLNDNAVTIYDGVLKGKPKKIEKKENYFLFVGRLQEAKGDLNLLKSFVEYVHRGGKYNLYYVGGYTKDRENTYNNIIESESLYGRVKLFGFREDVTDFMCRAKALFVPSRFEGFGFITAEAMFNHCLVVGRNTAGTKEQFDNGVKMTGKEIGVRFIDDNEMLQIMFDIEKNDYTDVVNRGFDVVSKLYTVEENANKIFELYCNILSMTRNKSKLIF